MSRTRYFATLLLGVLIGYQLGNTVMTPLWRKHPRWGIASALVVVAVTLGYLVYGMIEMKRLTRQMRENQDRFTRLYSSEDFGVARRMVVEAQERVIAEQPSITCPECGMTNDIFHGWCGKCERQTSQGERI